MAFVADSMAMTDVGWWVGSCLPTGSGWQAESWAKRTQVRVKTSFFEEKNPASLEGRGVKFGPRIELS